MKHDPRVTGRWVLDDQLMATYQRTYLCARCRSKTWADAGRREVVCWYCSQKEWKAYDALPWWKKLFTRRPRD